MLANLLIKVLLQNAISSNDKITAKQKRDKEFEALSIFEEKKAEKHKKDLFTKKRKDNHE